MTLFVKPVFAICFMVLGSIFISCQSLNKKKIFPDTPRYEISRPHLIQLPGALDEISGLAFYPKDSSLFAIVDEDALLYKFQPKSPKTLHFWPFGKKRDMEDIVLMDSTFYVLVSNGDVITIRFSGDSLSTEKSDFSPESKKVYEFESLYIHDSGHLTLMCKDCDSDSSSGVSTFLYDINTKQYSASVTFNTSQIPNTKGKKKFHLKPSAAAINPVTGEVYILSAINNMLVIASPNGTIKEVYPLDPDYYKQPEGIAFTTNGDMFISNEFAEMGTPTLLFMKNKMKGK
jgi:uncharacterized protein YjiK